MFDPIFESWLEDEENFSDEPNYNVVEASANLVRLGVLIASLKA